ncbi:hypothetical protein E1301_Tti019070 [Triplophysa tibetana]|uniref:Uncharacterized protein n=1 Tax=Triplophysa tibetana TaxID=1572043 RepID=A0A5A9NQU6_9TELE|nr:hypothetical protein E1301_Tti019070 [Triplophysa tibetana]
MQKMYKQSSGLQGKMQDYCDGAQYAGHPLYQNHSNALQIQLYFDDLETTNPLGSKTKIHKMGAVYFALRNVPSENNSVLSNIHLCLLFNSIDRDIYGFDKILEPLLTDIKEIEQNGIEVKIGDECQLLYGTVCLLTADNLACHSLCGYVESFSANRFCQFCLIDKPTSQYIFDEDNTERRTRENYACHVQLNDASATGVKVNSCLNSLQYFHVTENIGVDIMHDVLEGVAPLEVKLMLRHFIYEEKRFSLEQLNERIAGFGYGYENQKNKPSVIVNLKTSENAIRQTASQMWCLLLVLPFLMGDLIDPNSPHWHLYLLLREICDIIFAPVVKKGLAVYLKQLIIDHHTHFKFLYPDRNLIPKHHFMTHYPSIMTLFGPLSKLWCMRFEAKHNPLKRQAQVVCNFKNISKTLAQKHQIQQMYHWKLSSPLNFEMTVPNAFPVMIASLYKGDKLLDKLKTDSHFETLTYTSSIHVTNNINFLGTSYRTGCILSLKADERGEPLFGEVIHIIPKNESEYALMFLRVLKVQYFDEHLFSFNVMKTKEFDVAKLPGDLMDYRPLDIVSFCDQQYITPRYKILF